MLNVGIKTLREQMADLNTQKKNFEAEFQKNYWKTESTQKDWQKQRMELDAAKNEELSQFKMANKKNYENTMELAIDDKGESEKQRRHDEEKKLDDENIEKKTTQLDALKADKEGLHQKWLSDGPLQESIAEEKELIAKIEKGKVEIQMMQIEVNLLDEQNKQLYERKDTLAEEKQSAEL